MTWTSTLALCASSSLAAAGLTALYFRSRLSAANLSLANYKAWWERDSGKMLVAQAELDLIAEQRRSAGRQSHKAERARFLETADRLRFAAPSPPRPRAEIEAEVAALRAARKAQADRIYRPGRGKPEARPCRGRQ